MKPEIGAFVAESNSQLRSRERFHRILRNLNVAIISLVLKISVLVIVRLILKSHKFFKIIFGLEQPFLICPYSLSFGHCSWSNKIVFPFTFFLQAAFSYMQNCIKFHEFLRGVLDSECDD